MTIRRLLAFGLSVLAATHGYASAWTWKDECALARKVKDGFEAEYRFIPGTDRDGALVTVDSLQFPCSCTVYTFKIEKTKTGGDAVLKVFIKEDLPAKETKQFTFIAFPTKNAASPQSLDLILENP